MLNRDKLYFILIVVLSVALYFDDFKYISGLGFSFTQDSLGPFLFIVSAYVVWINKERIKNAKIEPRAIGIVGVLLAFIIYFIGLRAELPQIYHISFVIFSLSSICYLFGYELTKILFFPIAYTLFLVPVNKEVISIPLRFFSLSRLAFEGCV
ncbi:archaeosortase/exosortase family protein [Candidatus Auribacterota bacterium]